MAAIVIYDPTDSLVPDRVTAYYSSGNTPSFNSEPNKLVNPDLSAVSGVSPAHWKRSGSTVVEMSVGEKALVAPGAYDSTEYLSRNNDVTTQTVTSTPITIEMDNGGEDSNLYTYAAGEVTFLQAGTYRVHYSFGGNATSGTRSGGEHCLELNNILVPGSKGWTYHRSATVGQDTTSVFITLENILENDVIRIRSFRYAGGNLITLAHGCRLSIEKIK